MTTELDAVERARVEALAKVATAATFAELATVETEVLGRRAYPTLASAVAAEGPVDIVDVFRRPDLCVPHAEEAVAAGAACLWLQLGIVNWEAARIAAAGGLDVVMDRCTSIEVARTRR